MGIKSMLRSIDDHGVHYQSLMFICPGCELNGGSGLHMLPVNTDLTKPAWTWDGNLELPTLSPSVLTKYTRHFKSGDQNFVCHLFLKAGVFEFLSDCTHELAGQHVPIPDLPSWITDEGGA